MSFIQLNIQEKWDHIKSSSRCFNCLDQNHRSFQCIAPKCEKCKRAHHTLLHNADRIENDTTSKLNSNAIYATERSHSKGCAKTPKRAFLPIVKAKVKNGENSSTAITLVDTASEVVIISKRLAKSLHLKGSPIAINTVGVGAVITEQITEMVSFFIEDQMKNEIYIEAIVLEEACGDALPIPPELVTEITTNMAINTNCLYTKGGKVDLIGMSVPELHKQTALHEYENGLAIMETRLGSCIVGKSSFNQYANYVKSDYNVQFVSIQDEIDLWKYVEAENAGISKECDCIIKTDEEIRYERVMNQSWSRNDEGHFEVKLPWKIDPNTLENNRSQAIHRDDNLNKQLAKKSHAEKPFSEQIQEMITKGVLKKVENEQPKRYLPLLAVVNLERDTTKVRVCLDARTKFKNRSLNDALLKGKLEMPDILQIITSFRVGKYAILGDVQKMFWQIHVHPDDQNFQGVIWRKETYVFTRVCFGNKPSPPIAEESMVKIAHHGKISHSEGSKTLSTKRYVDDVADSGNEKRKMIQVRDEINELLGEFGFDVKLWYSNHKDIGTVEKYKTVLGCKWDMEKDYLSVHIDDKQVDIMTKRNVL